MNNIQSLNQIDSSRWHDIMKLRSSSFVTEQKCVYTDPDDGDRNATHFSVYDEDQLVAYARLLKFKNWQIGRVAVCQKQRGKGLGSLLMKKCLEHISSTDPIADIELSAQLYLSKFYGSIGFNIVGSMYLEDGIPHIKMVYAPLVKTSVKNN